MAPSHVITALLIVVAGLVVGDAATRRTPYHPTHGWSYYLVARRGEVWPACPFRFISYNTSRQRGAPSSSTHHDELCGASLGLTNATRYLWNGNATDQAFSLVAVAGKPNTFQLLTTCGTRLKYATDCADTTVALTTRNAPIGDGADTWTFAAPHGASSVGAQLGEFTLFAEKRHKCRARSLAVPGACPLTAGGDDAAVLLAPHNSATAVYLTTWSLYPTRNPKKVQQSPVTDTMCPDPFAWRSREGRDLRLACTGGRLALWKASAPISEVSTRFEGVGVALTVDDPPPWATNGARWAPETHSVTHRTRLGDEASVNILAVCDQQPGGPAGVGVGRPEGKIGPHRIGYVVSPTGAVGNGSWTQFSPNYLKLSPGTAGDIDPHFFTDPNCPDNTTYLVWKSDDNRIGRPITRIWQQRVRVDAESGRLHQLDAPRVILDSTGLWWALSFLGPDTTLVEGPEMVYHRGTGYYYLFFAAGQYCWKCYSEGVARARSATGPFEKLRVPLLSTGLVGYWNQTKLHGPGHGSFVWKHDPKTGGEELFMVFPAHTTDGPTCARFPFITKIEFTDDGWPYFPV